jgi:hypothetical protein
VGFRYSTDALKREIEGAVNKILMRSHRYSSKDPILYQRASYADINQSCKDLGFETKPSGTFEILYVKMKRITAKH